MNNNNSIEAVPQATRKINIVQAGSLKAIETDAKTWAELKVVIQGLGIDPRNKRAVNGETEVSYESDSAILPTGDANIFLYAKENKSGHQEHTPELEILINEDWENLKFFPMLKEIRRTREILRGVTELETLNTKFHEIFGYKTMPSLVDDKPGNLSLQNRYQEWIEAVSNFESGEVTEEEDNTSDERREESSDSCTFDKEQVAALIKSIYYGSVGANLRKLEELAVILDIDISHTAEEVNENAKLWEKFNKVGEKFKA